MAEEQTFYSILTPYGKSVANAAFNGGPSVQLAQMAVGFGTQDNGNGGYVPDVNQADLLNEWYRFDLNSLSIDPDNPAWLVAEGIIREDVGGHWISEVSIIDTTGEVIAISTWPPSYKSTLPEGSSSASVIRIVIEVSDTGNFELVIDTSLALVTRDEFLSTIESLPANLISEDTPNYLELGSDNKLLVSSGGGGPTLTSPTDLTIARQDGQLILSWNHSIAASNAGTRIVYKAGSYPININDGDAFDVAGNPGDAGTATVGGLTNGETYYFLLFAFDTLLNFSLPIQGNAAPIEDVGPVSNFAAVPSDGVVNLSWNNPGGTWTGTTIVRNESDYPASITDGTVLVDGGIVSSYSDSALNNGTTYYYRAFTTNGVNINDSTAGQQIYATPSPYKIFGSRWNKNASPTALTRIEDSVGLGFTPAVNGIGGSSDFDSQPIFQDIRLCNVVNGAVTAYQGDPGFSRTPASGDVMVEIPKFYYKVVDDTNTRDYLISDAQIDNTWLVSPRHAPTAANPNGFDKIYVSAYTLNSSYRSMSGNQSAVSMTRATARTNCAARGSGYSQYDYTTYATIQLLYLIEVADWDSQAAVGQGNVGTSAQINTGDTDGITFHSGSTVNTGVQTGTVKYRHMENLWGNIYQWVDGININDQQAYLGFDPSQYADDTTTNYNAVSYTNYATSGEFIKQLGFDPNYPFAQMCVEGGGSDGTYIPDRYYTSSGWRVLRVGGSWNYTTYIGLFAFYGIFASTVTYASVGCRLLFLP